LIINTDMTEHKYNDRRHAFIEKMKVMKMATCHMGTWMMGDGLDERTRRKNQGLVKRTGPNEVQQALAHMRS
jgi:hypothetical protein